MTYEIPPLAFTVTPHKESYYDAPLAGLRVYEDDKLVTSLNKGFGKELDCSIKGSKLSIDHGNLEIAFHRTIRVPDDGKEYELPPSLGRFPIFNIAEYESTLPVDMREKGGVFIPMYQREAMWMSFHSKRQFAMKVYLGGVNGISGGPMIPNMATYLKQSTSAHANQRKQDYIVVPSQPWLDGVAVSPGLVKQFVAMPFGSGYSVEKQVTGAENAGGIQLEVIPTYDRDEYFISRNMFFEEMVPECRSLDVMATGKDLGLQVGEIIYCKRASEMEKRVRRVEDLLSSLDGDVLELDLCTMISRKLNVRVWGESAFYSVHTFSGDSTTPFEYIGIEMERRTGLPRAGRCIWMDDREVTSWAEMYRRSQTSIRDRDDIMLVWAQQFNLTIRTLSDRRWRTIKSAEPETVRSLVERVWALTAYPSKSDMRLIFKNRQLGDCGLVGGIGIVDGDCLKLSCRLIGGGCPLTPENREMTIAVGGTVRQKIHPDNEDPQVWDAENARIINVQVLNSVTFEEITGMAVPETPISPETYASNGLPFFELYGEQPTTVSGTFSMVKTVSEMDAVMQAGAREDAVYDPAIPQICTVCKTRIRDCLLRPCNHCICKQCAERILPGARTRSPSQCPKCQGTVARIVGISGPMNAPGHEGGNRPFKVITLNIEDRRERFTSIRRER